MICRITQINEENYEYYLPMLPVGFIEILSEDEKTLPFGIETLGSASGAVIVRLVGFTAEITWFYLSPGFRGSGVGSTALLKLADLLHSSYEVDEIYMDICSGSDENLIRIFDGFSIQRTRLPQCTFETPLGALRSSEKLKGASKGSIALSDLDQKKLMTFCNELIASGKDYVFMPIEADDYIKDKSAVYMEDGQPTGILLFSKKDEGIEISFMASLSKKPTAIPDMIMFSLEKFQRFGEDTLVTVNIVEPKIKTLLKSLLSMAPEDDYGFTYSERITLDLSFLDVAEESAKNMIDTWKDFLSLAS